MHTSPGKCGPFCHPIPNFSFDSFLCYQDKMIPCFVEIFRGGKYEYRHSKSITKPKYKLPPDLGQKQDVFADSAFYNKK